MKIGVIGVGYWGPNYVRTLKEMGVDVCCADISQEALNKVKEEFDVEVFTDYFEMLNEVGAVIVATPAKTHFEIVKDCLEKVDVLVEKPFACKGEDCSELNGIAEKNSKVLMVGHIYEHNKGIQKIKELIDSGELGEIKNVQFQRIGFGPVRKDVSALWDLALHDVSIALFLLGKEPDEVNAVGSSWLQEGIEDSVILNLRFEDVNVGINAGWFSPVKERKLVIVGDKKMASFDDVSKELQVFNKCMENGCLIDKGVETEKVEDNPLKEEIEHFLECVKMRKAPLSGAGVGERVVRILEEAEGKLKGE